MDFFHSIAHTYPLMRGGAVLFILVGLGIIVGGIGGRKWVLPSLITGAALAITAMAALSATKVIFAGLGSPQPWHWVVMTFGFAVEIALVNLVVYKIRDHTSRQFWLWILAVVGAHFLVFTFSHGIFAGILGILCIINALIGLRLKNVSYRVFWIIDGFLKLGIGSLMLWLTY